MVPGGLDPADILEDVLRDYRLVAGTPHGGNKWVIGATRTRSGRPILASDPYRAMTLPSHRFLTHLVAPGLNVIGAGEPHLPGISLGHNGSIAFGLTSSGIGQEDLYGTLPVPGDGRYEWAGFRSTELLPSSVNPPED